MTKSKIQNKSKMPNSNFTTSVFLFGFCILCFFWILCFGLWNFTFAQEGELEFALDVTSNTTPLPKIFKPNIDFSGRGFHRQGCWPQSLAATEVLDIWQKDIGFGGMYRLQYNLWEINQLAKDKDLQDKLRGNYDNILKKITDSGGVVILDIFSTPAGMGKALDKKSVPVDLKAFKQLVKNAIRTYSCQKKYNIWYEVWSAPDLDAFFLGRKQEYLNLYRAVAECIKELEEETKIHIPLGGPSTSAWFQNLEGNTIVTPEKSLIYELIKFCSNEKLPLDFITWHAYSTDAAAEKELTIYNKTAVALMRDWLSYFNFDRNMPLVVDEWNFDRDANLLPERAERSNVCASYIPSRIRNMYEAGVDYQLYFCLEDFQNNREGVVRNVGIFSFDSDTSEYTGGPKSIYNIFRMLNQLGNEVYVSSLKPNDEFAGVIATKGQDYIAILVYNYSDSETATSYLTKNIATLNNAERKILLNLIRSNKLNMVLRHKLEVVNLREASNRMKTILKKTQGLNDKAIKFSSHARNIKINIKNLKENYLYQRYKIDSACVFDCEFTPAEEKQVKSPDLYQEVLEMNPYTVQLIILKKKPPEPEVIPVVPAEVPKVEQPPVEKPTAQPPAEQPQAPQPTPGQPAIEKPAVQQVPAGQPPAEKPTPEKPATEQPLAQPPAEQPSTDKTNKPS